MAIYVDPNGNAMDKPLSDSRAVSLRAQPGMPATTAPPQLPPVNMGAAQEVQTMRGATNPNVGPGRMSAEAQQWQQMRAAPSAPGTAAGADASRAYQAGRAAGEAVGTARNFVNGTAGRLVGGVAAADAIGQSRRDDSTARYAKRFGMDEPTGDQSIGDIAKFAGLRALGFASDLGNNLTGGLAGKYLFRDMQDQPAAAPNPGVMTKPAAPVALALAQPAPAATPGAPRADNVVMRNGNSFSGANVTEGFQYQDPSGLRTSPAGRVTSVPTVAGLDPALSRALSDARSAAVARGESIDMSGPRVIGINGGGNRNEIADLARSGKLTAAGLNAVVQSQGQNINAMTQMRGQDVQSRGQDLNYDLGMRGQDVQMRGQDMSNQVARAQARMEQMNKDRQYQLDVAKFGEEKAKTMFTQRQESDKALTSKLESMFTTRDKDGKAIVDQQAVAARKAGITAALGERIASLEAVPQNSADYAQAQQLAGQLREKGAAALTEDGLQRLIAQLEVKERSAAGHSAWNPFASTHVDSADPSSYGVVGVKKNPFLPDEYVLRNGGTVPQRYLDKAGGELIGGQRTTRFDILKQGLRNE